MRIKTQPADFLVHEWPEPALAAGPYSVYLLRKENRNTEDVLQELTRMLRIPRKDIGYCGNKDKNAITEQYITIKHGPREVRTPPSFTLTYIGQRKEPLRLGEHTRNFFTITVRDVTTPPQLVPVKNYFGEQRFGTHNAAVGFLLLKRQYREALALLGVTAEGDPIATLRKLPKHTLILYLHAAQSQLWNELASTLPAAPQDVVLPGFGTDNTQYRDILEQHGLTEDCFVNRSMPELSLEGSKRPLLQDVQHYSAQYVDERTWKIAFSLGTGSYATVTVEAIFRNEETENR